MHKIFRRAHTTLGGKTMVTLICLCISILGALNWMLIGIFSFNLVTAIVGAGVGARIVYIIVGLSALWLLGVIIWRRGKLAPL